MTVATDRTVTVPQPRPEPQPASARPRRARPSSQYWDAYQARWVSRT